MLDKAKIASWLLTDGRCLVIDKAQTFLLIV